MKRRAFLQHSAAALTGLAGLGTTLSAADSPGAAERELYELRLYHLRRGAKTKVLDEYLKQAALPAMNRAGVQPIGAFNVAIGPDSPTLYLLIPYKSAAEMLTVRSRLKEDKEYHEAGAEFLNAPATDPAFVRVESSLMAAFEGMPKLEVPAGKSRLFELRTYESHSTKAHLKKVEMFNLGEIAIFRRCGLQPVFFGQTLIGSRLPNLTYMLVYENMAGHDKCWGVFGGDPEWKKLSTTPGYTDAEIVSNITNCFLRPTGYSQI